MSTETKFEKPTYPSYNGLARTALIMGALPLIPTILVCVIAVLGALALQAWIGPAGLLFALFAVPILFFLRLICETDDRAMSILWLEIKCWFAGFFLSNSSLWNNTYTFTPVKYGCHFHVYKRSFEKTTVYRG